MSRAFAKAIRAVRAQAARHCLYCERTLLAKGTLSPGSRCVVDPLAETRDHIVPVSQGGVKTAPCCFQCNQMKGDLHPAEWRRFTEAHPQWWKLNLRHCDVVAMVRQLRDQDGDVFA